MVKKGGDQEVIKPGKVYLLLVLLLMGLLLPVSLEARKLLSYQKYQGPLRAGMEINQENFEKYLPELIKLLPPAKLKWYTAGLTKGIVTMPIVETRYAPHSQGQLEATRKYRGTSRLAADNQLLNWTAGIPFPQPKTPLEIAWNCYPTISRASAHEDCMWWCWYYLFKGNSYEKYFVLESPNRKYRGRTDFPPLGDMPAFKERGICLKESIMVSEPHEIKGFIQLRIKYWKIDAPDQCYGYIPALRRMRRFTGSDVTDPVLGTDMVMDDFEVWRQKLTSQMKFKVLEYRDFLVPRTCIGIDDKPAYDYRKHGPFFQVEWEIRPQWVLEVITNNPDYAYSKRILYIDGVPLDQGGTYLLYWGEKYDQKGRLWKANGQGAPADNGKGFKNMFNWIYMNVPINHYTAMNVTPAYVLEEKFNKIFPLDEKRAFTIKGLLKKAR